MPPFFSLDLRAVCTKCGLTRDVVLDARDQAELAPLQDADEDAPLRYTTAAPCQCGARLVKAELGIDATG